MITVTVPMRRNCPKQLSHGVKPMERLSRSIVVLTGVPNGYRSQAKEPRTTPTTPLKIIALFCVLACTGVSAQADNPVLAVADQILVQPKRHLSKQAARTLFEIHGMQEVDSIPQIDVRVLRVPAGNRDRVLAALQNNPNIQFAEVNGIAQLNLSTNDPEVVNGRQWHLGKIQAPEAWNVTSGGASTIIAVLDTGVSPNHPDLAGNLLQGYNFHAGNSNWADDHGHGTQVAGVAAAKGNNGIGIAGVAWNTAILPVKISDASANTTYAIIAKAVNYAADRGARLINISFGGTSSSSTLQSAVNYAWSRNAVIVAAAGNYGNSTPIYPAACQNVIAVAALDSKDVPASFSNFGSYVDVTGPGSMIYTAKMDGTYGYVSGTSFSSPLVAGVAALVAAAKPALTNQSIVDILRTQADDLGASGYDVYNGFGRVNACKAVNAAGGLVSSDAVAPNASITSPGWGSMLSGEVFVDASASDDTGVAKVEVYIDGRLQGASNQIPARFAWDTTASVNGTHTLKAFAYDAAGNVGGSVDVSVTVQNLVQDSVPPTAWINSPTANSTVTKSTKVYAGSSDDRGVVRVELYADGAYVGSSTSPSPVFSWNTMKISKGAHTLQVVAYDGGGNAGTSAQVSVFK